MKLNKSHLVLIAFTSFYLIAAFISFGSSANYEFLIYAGVVAILGLIVIFTLNKTELDLFVLWALSLWGLVHMLGGAIHIDGGVLYGLRLIDIFDNGGQFYILKFYQVVHFYGFGVCAIVVYQLLQRVISVKKNSFLIWFVSFLGAVGLGALNEVVEFSLSVALPKTGVGDVYNTGLDLIFNSVGAIVGAFIQNFRMRIKR